MINFNQVLLFIYFIKFQFILSYKTILNYACKSDHIDIINFIISLNQIDVNSKDILTFSILL